ncbi:hypothetical protein [uncultured Polaribacter sp.]|uniref:hypothetical protein n=1 Tax=uncultured Polaribacter sp. TaxID=174711 RepID=UPI0026325BA3|nr:hypothetical protein [uncultured Polaribacter sp.]
MSLSLNQNKNVKKVFSFDALLKTPFQENTNAICLKRTLLGNFAEIIDKIICNDKITVISVKDLESLKLSIEGNLAREILLNDMNVLEEKGAAPVLNIIKNYDADDSYPFFPTDVYSFHVDKSPIPTATFLCTYFGAASDIVSNTEATQKILIPEIREELLKLHDGKEEDFEAFLSDFYFDLHYKANPDAQITNLGIGNFWKLAVDHPTSTVLPCIHRAPKENGQTRLLMIC